MKTRTYRHKRKGRGSMALLFGIAAASVLALLIVLSGMASTGREPENELYEEVAEPLFTAEELSWFDDSFTSFLLQQRFNGTVLVARKGEVIYQRAFGFANFQNNTPLTTDTPFQLASISKTFTAAAILMLHHDSIIHIDKAVKTYIPEFPYPQMTVRHLLNHTSGIQNYMWLAERYWKQPYPPSNEDILRLFIRYPRPVDFAAGTRFAYSNTGYAFLALIVERVSGMTFARFMHEYFFFPLEMNNTFVFEPRNPQLAREDRAFGFRPVSRGFALIPDVVHDGVSGDKGIYSSVSDLYKWDRSIAMESLLPGHIWEMAFEPAVLRNERSVSYGLGWRLQEFLDGRIVHHPGRWNGFRTSFKRFLDGDATLILLTNTNRDITPVVNGMQHIIFHKEIALMSEKPTEDAGLYNDDANGH